MTIEQAKKTICIGFILLIVGIIVKYNQTEGEDMRVINVPIEVTDAQYQALESLTLYEASEYARLVASAAVTTAADRKLSEIADENMPRTTGFVGAETADAEAAYLLEQIQQKNVNERWAEEKPGGCLTARGGVFQGPSGREKYYNLDMSGVVDIMRRSGYPEDLYPYWVREDGVKMLGAYVMLAANLEVRPRGTILETSLGYGICADFCEAARTETNLIDVAVTW